MRLNAFDLAGSVGRSIFEKAAVLRARTIEQLLGLLRIARVKPFGEPAVIWAQQYEKIDHNQ
jgi:hypothetical protein